MGVGTLIIFIAMLLVAAIAAGVLIQTAGALQEKALTTGSQAKQQISTNVRVIEVSASSGLDSDVENFSLNLKLAPGSDPIKLEETTITFNTKNTTTTLTYNGTDTTDGFSTDSANENGTYSVEYLQKSANYVVNKVQRGDIIKVRFSAPRSVSEDETIRINIIPKSGSPTLVQFPTPDVIAVERVYLYP